MNKTLFRIAILQGISLILLSNQTGLGFFHDSKKGSSSYQDYITNPSQQKSFSNFISDSIRTLSKNSSDAIYWTDLEINHKRYIAAPQEELEIFFWAENADLNEGECTDLYWQINFEGSIYFEIEGENFFSPSGTYGPVCPVVDTQYWLTFYGQYGEVVREVDVWVYVSPDSPSIPEIMFWADYAYITEGECTDLLWDVNNAAAVSYIDVEGERFSSLSGSKGPFCPLVDTQYWLTLLDESNYQLGKTSVWVYVTPKPIVTEPPPPAAEQPEVYFYAENDLLTVGECTNLIWDVSNSSKVLIDGLTVSASGKSVECPDATTEYMLIVFDSEGIQYEPVVTTIEVIEPVVFYADKTEIAAGECVELFWEAPDSSTVSINDLQVTDPQGSAGLCPPESMDYTLTVEFENGDVRDYSVYITVKEKTVCKDISENILIVTNSTLLNQATNNNETWKITETALSEYYLSSAQDCKGMPEFLDLATIPGGDYSNWADVDNAIENYVSQNFSGTPFAVAVIGGPDVIPYGSIEAGPACSFEGNVIHSDDVYANFSYGNGTNFPESVITRLPDGHSLDLLTNYIYRLDTVSIPEGAGSSLILQFNRALERLAYNPTLFQGTIKTNNCYLEDILESRTGGATVLLSPPWGNNGGSLSDFEDSLIENLDVLNYTGMNDFNLSISLKKPTIVLAGLTNFFGGNDLFYSTSNAVGFSPAFGLSEAQSLPQGAGIFAMVNHSADMAHWGINTAENSVALVALKNNALYFIGDVEANGTTPFSAAVLGKAGIFDIDIQKGSAEIAKNFFLRNSGDPAYDFYYARNYDSQLDRTNVYHYCLWHSYQFLGLPKKMEGNSMNRAFKEVKYPDCVQKGVKSTFVNNMLTCPSGDFNDCDDDGLSNLQENWIANTWQPHFWLDRKEPVDKINWVYQVHPVDNLPDGINKPGVIFTVVTLFDRDFAYPRAGAWLNVLLPSIMDYFKFYERGTFEYCWHNGDAEAIEIWLSSKIGDCSGVNERVFNIGGAKVCYSAERVLIHRHTGPVHVYLPDYQYPLNENSIMMDATSTEGIHPNIYVSRGKHAGYPTSEICEDTTYEGTFCLSDVIGFDPSPFTNCFSYHREICSTSSDSIKANQHRLPPLQPWLNVGEREMPLFVKMEENPLLESMFPREAVWDDDNFCGGGNSTKCKWSLNPDECGGGIDGKWCGQNNENYCGGL